jgi:hypothetical protein
MRASHAQTVDGENLSCQSFPRWGELEGEPRLPSTVYARTARVYFRIAPSLADVTIRAYRASHPV